MVVRSAKLVGKVLVARVRRTSRCGRWVYEYNERPLLRLRHLLTTIIAVDQAKDEFDHWATIVGDSRWSFDAVIEHIKKFENLHVEDLPNGGTEYAKPDPRYHGYDGEIDLAIGPVLESEVKHKAPLNPDVNSGNPIGFGVSPHSSWRGMRTTSASAFLQPDRVPPNLTVLVDSRITRLHFDGDRVTGVEIESGERFSCSKDVILAGGAIDTPRLLLLSGIGPAKDMEKLNITVTKDVPGVGGSLTDHPTAFMTFEMREGFSDRHAFSGNPEAMEAAVKQFATDGTGPLTVHYGTCPVAFGKIDEVSESSTFASLAEPVQKLLLQPTVPHYEFAMCGPLLPPGLLASDAEGSFTFFVALQNSQARGSIKLLSSDPKEPPLIDPGYLTNEHDTFVLTKATQAALKFMETPTMQKYRKRDVWAPASSSYDDVKTFLKANVAGLWHPSCSMPMGHQDDARSAVGTDLLVHGFKNLRVADLSVTPFLPSGHPQIVAYIIGAVAVTAMIEKYHL
ncbi:hypothetical protein LTR56_000278 [Elasticomyces elasticus]|nr:hypothetical protein LTR56_000278 [Elasticomyces elasticus]KAK4933270.1 hypothetical protein LTR49_000264 [Elasticomyces elasticus]